MKRNFIYMISPKKLTWNSLIVSQVLFYGLQLNARIQSIYFWKIKNPDLLKILNIVDLEIGWGIYFYLCLILSSLIDHLHFPVRSTWLLKCSAIVPIIVLFVGSEISRMILGTILIIYQLPTYRNLYKVTNYGKSILAVVILVCLMLISYVYFPFIIYNS